MKTHLTRVEMRTVRRLKNQVYSEFVKHIPQHSFGEMAMMKAAIVHHYRISSFQENATIRIYCG